MKDRRIWPFKRRAEEDNLLTAGACRLILRIASWRYCTKHHPADAEFSLSATHIAAWYDYDGPEAIKNPKTIYTWLREAVLNRYLRYRGKKGCPAQACYTLELDYTSEPMTLFNWGAERASQIVAVTQKTGTPVTQKTGTLDTQKTGTLDTQKTGTPVTQKTGAQVTRKNRPPIIKYSLREEMYNERKKLSAAPPRQQKRRGKNLGSLRSKKTMDLPLSDGNGATPMPQPSKHSTAEDRAIRGRNPSAAARTGAAKPPGAPGRNARRSLSPEQQAAMDLHKARFYIESGTLHFFTEPLVVALLKAGEKIPGPVAERFAALLEKHNPIPG